MPEQGYELGSAPRGNLGSLGNQDAGVMLKQQERPVNEGSPYGLADNALQGVNAALDLARSIKRTLFGTEPEKEPTAGSMPLGDGIQNRQQATNERLAELVNMLMGINERLR